MSAENPVSPGKPLSQNFPRLISVLGIIILFAVIFKFLYLPPAYSTTSLTLLASAYNRIINSSIAIHTVAALIALMLAITAVFARKGGERHRWSGKIAVLSLVVVFITSFALLILTSVIPMPSNDPSRKDTLVFLAITILAGSYTTIQGYRWVASKQARIDTDVLMMGLALFTSIYCFAYVPYEVFLSPYVSRSTSLPMTPVTAAGLFLAVGVTNIYFFADDLKTYLKGKVTYHERILKHTYRIMFMAGTALTTVSIVHFSPFFFKSGLPIWPLYLVPQILIGAVTFNRTNQIKKASAGAK